MLREEFPERLSDIELDARRRPKVKQHEFIEKKIAEFQKKGRKIMICPPGKTTKTVNN